MNILAFLNYWGTCPSPKSTPISLSFSFSLFDPTQTMKQQMKDKHRTSKNKSTKLCESHIDKTQHEVKWMK